VPVFSLVQTDATTAKHISAAWSPLSLAQFMYPSLALQFRLFPAAGRILLPLLPVICDSAILLSDALRHGASTG
jgi:hypothetical protein